MAEFVATTTRQRFVTYCRGRGLDPHQTRYVRSDVDLFGHRDGRLTILPDFMDDWKQLVGYARAHGMEVVVL